jgi:hypothetical protein
VQPTDAVDEAVLIAAFRRRQEIEIKKVGALITAAVNPEKAHGAYLEYLRVMLPEYDQLRARMDREMVDKLRSELKKTYKISASGAGFTMYEMPIKRPAEEE